MNIQPLLDRVVLKKDAPAQTTTVSGIILPDSAKELPLTGEVISVGPGRYDNGTLIPMTVKVGDRVLFSQYGYEEIKNGEEHLCIIPEGNVLAVIK